MPKILFFSIFLLVACGGIRLSPGSGRDSHQLEKQPKLEGGNTAATNSDVQGKVPQPITPIQNSTSDNELADAPPLVSPTASVPITINQDSLQTTPVPLLPTLSVATSPKMTEILATNGEKVCLAKTTFDVWFFTPSGIKVLASNSEVLMSEDFSGSFGVNIYQVFEGKWVDSFVERRKLMFVCSSKSTRDFWRFKSPGDGLALVEKHFMGAASFRDFEPSTKREIVEYLGTQFCSAKLLEDVVETRLRFVGFNSKGVAMLRDQTLLFAKSGDTLLFSNGNSFSSLQAKALFGNEMIEIDLRKYKHVINCSTRLSSYQRQQRSVLAGQVKMIDSTGGGGKICNLKNADVGVGGYSLGWPGDPANTLKINLQSPGSDFCGFSEGILTGQDAEVPILHFFL